MQTYKIEKNGVTSKGMAIFFILQIGGWVFLIILVFVIALYFMDGLSGKDAHISSSGGAYYIPTIRQLQEALCEAGYPVEVDCVVGRETLKQWSSYCADREAMRFMTETGAP